MPVLRCTLLLAVTLLACQTSVQGLYVHFDVLQAISGGTFSPAGSISGELAENAQQAGKLTWNRPVATDSHKLTVAEAIKANKYLQVQVPTNPEDASSTPVVASVPARCLAGSHNNEALQLHLNPAGLITSIEYRANCDQATTDTLAKGWSPPHEVDVICKFPETVQSIRVVHSPGPGGGGIPAAATDYPEAQQGAADGSPSPKKAPPPDERPWWQKNWIFLIPAAMLLVNLLGGATDPAPARAGPAAASAAAPTLSGSKSRRGR